jgi:phosphatidylglycerol lysyltransferase
VLQTAPRQPTAAPVPLLSPAQPGTLLDWHARFAQNPSALAALPTMTHQLSLADVPGGIGLQRVGSVLVAAEPLAAVQDWPALASAFLALAEQPNAVPAFGPVGTEFAAVARSLGLQTVRLGSTPYIHLHDWPQRGNAGGSVRNAHNRARREGVSFCRLDITSGQFTPVQDEVQALCADWLKQRRAGHAFHWIFRLQPLEFSEGKKYFLARQEGRLIGLLAASPLAGRGCWYLEDLVQGQSAAPQTGTALVAHALNALKADGATLATLGGVPLSRQRGWTPGWDTAPLSVQERLAYRLRPLLGRVYSFDGLELFKRRFGPAHWEDEFLLMPAGIPAQLRVAGAMTKLVLRGR